jgi:dTDP-4-dehydrorhamnose reductase
MNLLVVGGTGMFGSDLTEELRRRGHTVGAPSRAELDLVDPEAAARVAAGVFGPVEWCLNCAAYTAVDKAESERQAATEMNTLGPAYLARACAMAGLRMLHVSTDFVFDGSAARPYSEDDPTSPLGVYGQTKRDGEEAVLTSPGALVVRTSWLFGPRGASFPRTMIRAYEAGKPLRVVDDQTGRPTYTADLARVVADLLEREPEPGVYHAAGPETMTWHELAVRSLQAWRDVTGNERPVEVAPIQSADYPTPAARPMYSVLATEKVEALGIPKMRSMAEALPEFCRRLAKDARPS